ncbi:MAG: hypothetical protein QOD61_2798 [Solirubrobacteraceae bacterium]|jgi:hypothetical protein|nr:hypothetical protein [Solirubrobacteraceae bacterium]
MPGPTPEAPRHDGIGRARSSGLLCLLLTAALLAGLAVLRGEAFWSTSDGVYAVTARELLHGAALYHSVAAAQPPVVYLVGAGLLGLHDSLTALRAGLELAMLATAMLVWLAVLRLTRRPGLALIAGVLTPLTPLMLHENALLTPETLGTPLLLGCALLSARRGGAAAAGLLGAVCVATKLSFALPVLLILLAGRHRRRGLAFAAGGLVGLAGAGSLVFGVELWQSIVTAQQQTGFTPLHDALGLLGQEAWNELPLTVIAGVALLVGRARALDPTLLRVMAATGVGCLVVGLSVVKLGSYVNTVQVAEPALVVLAACGAAWIHGRLGPWQLPSAVVAGLAAALVLAESASLLLSPADPSVFTRPGASSGPRRLLASAQVRAAAGIARHCDPAAAYPGIPFIAFVAGRRVPGGQPDGFIVTVRENRRFALRADADRKRCPTTVPEVDDRGDVHVVKILR